MAVNRRDDGRIYVFLLFFFLRTYRYDLVKRFLLFRRIRISKKKTPTYRIVVFYDNNIIIIRTRAPKYYYVTLSLGKYALYNEDSIMRIKIIRGNFTNELTCHSPDKIYARYNTHTVCGTTRSVLTLYIAWLRGR